MSDTNNKRSKTKQEILLKRRRSKSSSQGPRCSTQPIISGVSMRVRKYIPEALPRPVVLDPTLRTSGRRSPLSLATSCPAQRGKADVMSGLPADAASLRETVSVDRYTPRVPVSHRIV